MWTITSGTVLAIGGRVLEWSIDVREKAVFRVKNPEARSALCERFPDQFSQPMSEGVRTTCRTVQVVGAMLACASFRAVVGALGALWLADVALRHRGKEKHRWVSGLVFHRLVPVALGFWTLGRSTPLQLPSFQAGAVKGLGVLSLMTAVLWKPSVHDSRIISKIDGRDPRYGIYYHLGDMKDYTSPHDFYACWMAVSKVKQRAQDHYREWRGDYQEAKDWLSPDESAESMWEFLEKLDLWVKTEKHRAEPIAGVSEIEERVRGAGWNPEKVEASDLFVDLKRVKDEYQEIVSSKEETRHDEFFSFLGNRVKLMDAMLKACQDPNARKELDTPPWDFDDVLDYYLGYAVPSLHGLWEGSSENRKQLLSKVEAVLTAREQAIAARRWESSSSSSSSANESSEDSDGQGGA